jgi:hypothetical protein
MALSVAESCVEQLRLIQSFRSPAPPLAIGPISLQNVASKALLLAPGAA